jgi:hypothetical protein
MKSSYQLSTDYQTLFNLLQDGSVFVGFIKTEKIPVKIEALGKMGILCRTITKDWFEYRVNSIDKKDEFIAQCKMLKLEWIVSQGLRWAGK